MTTARSRRSELLRAQLDDVRADRDAWRDQAQAGQRLLAPPERPARGYGMNRTFKAAVAALIFAIGFAGLAVAGPYEDCGCNELVSQGRRTGAMPVLK